jgi:hypothetical protein
MRFCNSLPRQFLIAGPAATQMRVPSLLLILSERQSTSTSAGKLTGKNIPSSELRALDFIGSGKQDEPRTQNIPELGISCSIPLTEYYMDLSSTLN